MKTTRADYYFSLYIRYRDGRCVRCLKRIPIKDLTNSHFFGRTMTTVRYDEENCDALCRGCHPYWEKEDRVGYQAFKVKQLGEARFNRLVYRANRGKGPDEFYVELFYYKRLKEMGVQIASNKYLDSVAAKLL